MKKQNEERRQHRRFDVLRNVGEPVELQVIKDHKQIVILGFILNLSAGGLRMVTLGDQACQLSLGTPFLLSFQIPNLKVFNIEGQIISIQRGEKAKLHHTNGEWFLSLAFTKINPADVKVINHMAEDWNICETKIQMQLPDICFRECTCWELCEKNVKLQS